MIKIRRKRKEFSWFLLIALIGAVAIVGGILFGSIQTSERFSNLQQKESFVPPKDRPTREDLSNLPPRYTITGDIEDPHRSSEWRPITRCAALRFGGKYYLPDDIYNIRNVGLCVPILTDEDITIDCNGNSFINLGDYFDFADQAIDTYGGYDGGLIVEDCRFEHWFQPLSLRNSRSSSINNVFYDNYYGLVVGSSTQGPGITDIEIRDNLINDTVSNEIVFLSTSQASISNNYICATPGGYYGPYNIYCDDQSMHGVIGSSYFFESNWGCLYLQRQQPPCLRPPNYA